MPHLSSLGTLRVLTMKEHVCQGKLKLFKCHVQQISEDSEEHYLLSIPSLLVLGLMLDTHPGG